MLTAEITQVFTENISIFQMNRETLAKQSIARWVGETTDVILDVEDVNVIQVNWKKGASVDYDQATSNTRLIGHQVGHLVKMLMVSLQYSFYDF